MQSVCVVGRAGPARILLMSFLHRFLMFITQSQRRANGWPVNLQTCTNYGQRWISHKQKCLASGKCARTFDFPDFAPNNLQATATKNSTPNWLLVVVVFAVAAVIATQVNSIQRRNNQNSPVRKFSGNWHRPRSYCSTVRDQLKRGNMIMVFSSDARTYVTFVYYSFTI